MFWKDIAGGAYLLITLWLSIWIGIKLTRMIAEFFGEDLKDLCSKNPQSARIVPVGVFLGIGIFILLYRSGCWLHLGLLSCN